MKKAPVRFVVITVLLLKLLSVTIYAESALASADPLPGGFAPGEKPEINAGLDLFSELNSFYDAYNRVDPGGSLAADEDSSTLPAAPDSLVPNNRNEAAILSAVTWLQVASVSEPYTGNVNLSATLKKGLLKTTPVAGREISFKLDGNPVGSALTNSDGVAALKDVQLPPDLNVGPHVIKAEFDGDGAYKKSSGLGLLTITYAPTKLTAEDVSAPYGSTVTIRSRLISSFTGMGLKDKVITVLINNNVKGMAITDADGVAALDVELGNMEVGSYPILVTFLQVIGNYSPNTASATLKVEELPTSLVVSSSTGTYGGAVRLEAALTSLNAPVADKTVKFTFNGSTYSAQTDAAGIAAVDNVSISGIDAGLHKTIIAAEFSASGFYSGSSAAGDLTVEPAPTALSVSNAAGTFGAATGFTAKLTSGAAPLEGRTISFKLQGVLAGSAQTDANGIAVLSGASLQGYNAGSYSGALTADFSGEGNYAPSSGTGDLTVNPAPTSLTAGNASGVYKGTTTLTAVLTSAGSKLAGMTISFTLNGLPAGTAVTDNDGLASLNNVSLPEINVGTYNNFIQANFSPSNGNYSGSSGTADLTVKELPTSILVSASTGIYGGSVTLQAALSSSDAPLADRTISFTVNGNPAGSAKTLPNGIASLQFSLAGINAGSYTDAIKAEFTAEDNYGASSASGSLKVGQAPTSISVANAVGIYAGTVDLTAALSSDGTPLEGMNISFAMNGTSLGNAPTGKDGIAVLKNVRLSGIDAGEHGGAVTADFTASGNYASSSASGSLTVQRAPSAIVVPGAAGTFDGKVTLSAQLTAALSGIALGGRTLSFKINGVDKGSAVTGDDGTAVLPEISIAGIPVGTYEDYVEAVFSPSDGNYAPGLGKGRLEIGLAPTCISINKITAVYGSKVDLEAILTSYGSPLRGKPVEFTLNGIPVGAAITDNEGKASKSCINLIGIGAGLHPGCLGVSFAEANPYKGCSSTADLEITKASTCISVLPVEVQYSDEAAIIASVSSAAQENLNKSGGCVEFKYQLENGPLHKLETAAFPEVVNGKLTFNCKFTCNLDPDTYKIFAYFTPSDQANFNSSCNTAPNGTLLVEPENAVVDYTGLQYFSTASSCSTSVTLSAAITDTADCSRGDISKARLEFREAALGSLYNDWIVQAANLPVLLINPADNTAGNSTAQPFSRALSQCEINTSGTSFDVYTKVSGNYTKLSHPSLVTIGISGNDNISGGGFVVPKSPAGKYPGKKGAKTDFGFTMKYNKSCETTPGQASIIIRGEDGKIYQVKSSTISSLSAYPVDKMPGKAASFNASAELIDITNPFNLVALGKNLCLTIEMYDDCNDSKMNAISITLKGPDSELLYSNNWDGSKTAPQSLDLNSGGGTIKVLGSSVLSGVDPEKIIPKEYALFQNYPNPFNPSTTIQYDLPEDSRVKIAVYDILGKEIASVVSGEIPAGRHQAVWNSQNGGGSFASGMYILLIRAESINSQRSLITAKKMMLIK